MARYGLWYLDGTEHNSKTTKLESKTCHISRLIHDKVCHVQLHNNCNKIQVSSDHLLKFYKL